MARDLDDLIKEIWVDPRPAEIEIGEDFEPVYMEAINRYGSHLQGGLFERDLYGPFFRLVGVKVRPERAKFDDHVECLIAAGIVA